MKTIKCLLIGVLATAMSTPLMAQDNKTTIDAIAKVIKADPEAAKDQVKDVYKKNN